MNFTNVFCFRRNNMMHVWHSNGIAKRRLLSNTCYLASSDIAQLEERKEVYLKVDCSTSLSATIFLPTMFDCWHTSHRPLTLISYPYCSSPRLYI